MQLPTANISSPLTQCKSIPTGKSHFSQLLWLHTLTFPHPPINISRNSSILQRLAREILIWFNPLQLGMTTSKLRGLSVLAEIEQ